MTRLCREPDLPTDLKWNPRTEIPPSFNEFDREKPTFVRDYGAKEYPNVREGCPSDVSEPEVEAEVQRGNPLWTKLKREYHQKLFQLYDRYVNAKKNKSVVCEDAPEVKCLWEEVMPTLMPTVVECLETAAEKNLLRRELHFFDPIDFIAEKLYNNNPNHRQRATAYLPLFDIPEFKEWVQTHPRPNYPRSWNWGKEEAAVVIQRNVRGWLVRKKPEIENMRKFWELLIGKAGSQSQADEALIGSSELAEIYPDIHLNMEQRKGMTYDDVYDKKVQEINQQMKEYELAEQEKENLMKVENVLNRS